MLRTQRRALLLLGILLTASVATAAGPGWMPGFPMRMGPNVMLMWTPVPGASAYNVYKSDKDGQLGPLLIALPMNNHMDMNVPMETSAYYTVKPVVGGAEGDAGPVGAIIGVKPLDPPKWTGDMKADGQVTVRFDRVAGAAFYNVFKAESEAGPFSLVGSIQDTKYVDATVEEEKTYYYQVSAVDKNNMESPRSETYVVTIEKKKVVVAAKVWEHAPVNARFVRHVYSLGEYGLQAPTWGAANASGELFAFADDDTLFVLDRSGKPVAQFGKPDSYDGDWGQMRGICFNGADELVTSWIKPSVVRVFSTGGELLSEFAVESVTRAEFDAYGRGDDFDGGRTKALPAGIAATPDGHIWVSDGGASQLLVYSADGELLKRIGEPKPLEAKPENIMVYASMAYHPDNGRVYAVSALTREVRVFDAAAMDFVQGEDGEPLYGWTRAGSTVGNVQQPKGISITSAGEVLVVDGIDGRVQFYDSEMDYKGTVVTAEGEKKAGEVTLPVSAAVLGKTLIVTEQLNKRLVVLELP